MESDHDLYLLKKFIRNQCSSVELIEVDKIFRKGVLPATWERLLSEFENEPLNQTLTKVKEDELFKKIELHLSSSKVKQLQHQRWISIAASLILFIGIGYGTYKLGYFKRTSVQSVVTLQGERQSLIASDGSKIWLNNESTIKYNKEFTRKERSVELVGEAFFEVVKEPDRPFVVNTQGISIKVLGTSFDVKSFEEDNEIVVTLESGKVAVYLEAEQIDLMPGEQLRLNKITGKFKKLSVNTYDTYSWRDGWLSFNGSSLKDIAVALERWYAIEIEIENERLGSKKITFQQKDETLQNAMEILSYSGGFDYEIDNRRIIIKEKKLNTNTYKE